MTDLENHVNRPGRDKLVKEVRQKIKELGVTYIYYQFASVTGRIVGKGIPADHWERLAERGFQLVYGSTANLFLDRHGHYIGYGPESSELVGIWLAFRTQRLFVSSPGTSGSRVYFVPAFATARNKKTPAAI
jgi:glutamine synthetase